MGTIRNILRKTLLRPLFHWQRRTWRSIFFQRKLKELVENPNIQLDDPDVLKELTYGWVNSISPSIEYLIDMIKYSSQAKYPILDCGSGLSTIVAGIVAKRHGNSVWSLENSKSWYRRVKHYLDKYQLNSVRLLYCPIKEYPDFFWYDVPLGILPEKFSLISCDGPHKTEEARRYGMFSIMKERFAPGCVILFDNCNSGKEQDGLYFWMNELLAQYEIRKGLKGDKDTPFLLINIPQ